MVPTLTIAYEASAAVEGFRIARFSDAANSSRIAHAAANTDAILGVTDRVGAAQGGMADVHMDGTADCLLGGTVVAGAALTADSEGRAIASTAGAGRRIVGFALEPGVSGDIIKVRVAPGFHSA